MPRVTTNGVELEYRWLGSPDDPAVIGVVGLCDQIISWPPALVEAVLEAGFSFVVFDSRDTGLSTHFDDEPVPDMAAVLGGQQPFTPPYTLRDMAADTTGLMDTLGIRCAHVVGYSMGGAVAQLAVAARPDLFASLTCVFSTSYAPGLPGRDADVNARMLACCDPDLGPAAWVQRMDHLLERINGRRYQLDDSVDAGPARLAERRFDAAGMARHVLAIFAHRQAPPLEALGQIRVPSLVINSDDDCLFDLSHGEDLSRRLGDATLVRVEGAGHAFCNAVAPVLAEAIVPHLKRAQAGT